jgi:hypothetical protein
MKRRAVARVAGLTALPWMIVYGGTLAYWPLFYYLAPVFLPTLCHQRSPGNRDWSIFIEPPWGFLIALLYTFVCALAAVHLSSGRRPLASAAITVGVWALASAVIHLSLPVLGFRFYMDTP